MCVCMCVYVRVYVRETYIDREREYVHTAIVVLMCTVHVYLYK